MTRQRSILYVQQYKELVSKHVNEMNSIIRGVNDYHQKDAQQRLDRLLGEALAVLEIDTVIQQYLDLQRQQRELADRFKLMVGTSVALEDYLPEKRPALLDKVSRTDSSVPELIYEEIDLAGKRHGIVAAEVRKIPYLQEKPLVDELRDCGSKEEILDKLNRNQGKVLAMLGIEPEDIMKLLIKDTASQAANSNHEESVDDHVPSGPGTA